jgi:hypothetical protein
VRDAHTVIVDHDGQVVGWEPVGLEQNLIIDRRIVEGDLTAKHIANDRLPGQGHLQPHNVRTIGRNFAGRARPAMPVIHQWLLPGALNIANGFQALRRAVTAIRMTVGDQTFSDILVQSQAFRLDVGTRRTANRETRWISNAGVGKLVEPWTLIPLESKPPQVIHDRDDALGLIALAIRILNTEDERPVCLPGE